VCDRKERLALATILTLGRTVLGIAGEDFALLASDTRLSEGFEILSRDVPKGYPLTSKTVLGIAGFHGDALTLRKNLEMRIKVRRLSTHHSCCRYRHQFM
jgi:20S proteasome subunit beta 6